MFRVLVRADAIVEEDPGTVKGLDVLQSPILLSSTALYNMQHGMMTVFAKWDMSFRFSF